MSLDEVLATQKWAGETQPAFVGGTTIGSAGAGPYYNVSSTTASNTYTASTLK
jgi:hypothetical protein